MRLVTSHAALPLLFGIALMPLLAQAGAQREEALAASVQAALRGAVGCLGCVPSHAL